MVNEAPRTTPFSVTVGRRLGELGQRPVATAVQQIHVQLHVVVGRRRAEPHHHGTCGEYHLHRDLPQALKNNPRPSLPRWTSRRSGSNEPMRCIGTSRRARGPKPTKLKHLALATREFEQRTDSIRPGSSASASRRKQQRRPDAPRPADSCQPAAGLSDYVLESREQAISSAGSAVALQLTLAGWAVFELGVRVRERLGGQRQCRPRSRHARADRDHGRCRHRVCRSDRVAVDRAADRGLLRQPRS